MSSITMSPKWKYSIAIKSHFTNEPASFELIDSLCAILIKQLRRINHQVLNSNLKEDEKDWASDNLFEVIDHFEFCQMFANGTIPESEWHEYEFTGDLQEMFNDYMTELYNLADARVISKSNVSEKFIWIK